MDFVPTRRGSTSNPFFRSGDVHVPPLPLARDVPSFLPSSLREMYASYPRDCEFVSPVATLLSEAEMAERKEHGCVPLSFSYAGMGHIRLSLYHPRTNAVLTLMEGGGNGYERMENAFRRKAALKAYDLFSRETEGGVLPFAAWWETVAPDAPTPDALAPDALAPDAPDSFAPDSLTPRCRPEWGSTSPPGARAGRGRGSVSSPPPPPATRS